MSKVLIYSPPSTAQIKRCSVDFDLRRDPPKIYLVQYDKTLPIVEVALNKGGTAYQLPEDAEVNIRMGKRNKLAVYNPVLGCNEDRDRVYVEITTQMTTQDGVFDPILELKVGGGIAGTSPILFVVQRNPVQDDSVEDETERKTVEEYARKASESASAAAKSAEEAREIVRVVQENEESIVFIQDNISDITTVAQNGSNISAVGGSIDNVNTVAENLTPIQEAVNNINDIRQAPQHASNAADSATLSQSWAVGGTGTRDGEDTNNAKYWAESITPGQFATAEQGKLANTAVQSVNGKSGKAVTLGSSDVGASPTTDVFPSILTGGIGGAKNLTGQSVDLQQINLGDAKGAENYPYVFGSETPSSFTNSPYTGGPFYGFRLVVFNGHLKTVLIIEQYPVSGRLWANTYDGNPQSWYGWKQIGSVSAMAVYDELAAAYNEGVSSV